jgi:uncharacterized protein (DUF362 family)
MSGNVSRRSFIKQGAVVGASSLLGAGMLSCRGREDQPAADEETQAAETEPRPNAISVITGDRYFDNTIVAVEQIGGMGQFVSEGSRVAVLANPQRNNPGAFTRPAIVAAIVRMCREAGAEQVACLSWQPEQNWENTGIAQAISDEGADLVIVNQRDESLFNLVPVPKGVALKEARLMAELANYDVLIDVPITKDHAGNKFTGTLKNFMGLNSPQSNQFFHQENWTTDIGAITHLEQCIADLNTVITPDLCVVDATELITTNGPFGPGELVRPQKIVAGTDRVAIDAYCCTLWGLAPHDIIAINKAFEHGLGEIDLSKVQIKEIQV